MVLIVLGISMKDRSWIITSICYSKEHSCLPCSILQSSTARWVKRPSVHYFRKNPQNNATFCVVSTMLLWCSGSPGTSDTIQVSFRFVVVACIGLSKWAIGRETAGGWQKNTRCVFRKLKKRVKAACHFSYWWLVVRREKDIALWKKRRLLAVIQAVILLLTLAL